MFWVNELRDNQRLCKRRDSCVATTFGVLRRFVAVLCGGVF